MAPAGQPHAEVSQARRWLVGGRVQGVGFRPHVYRLAHQHGLTGWVRNLSGEVEILAQGEPERLDRFARDLVEAAPRLAQPQLLSETPAASFAARDFRILASVAAAADVHLPPDLFACPDCLAELDNPADRRYRYPFINCTQCGPRYTVIRRLPYDRPNTTLAGFALCPECRTEYESPADRRFHAQPLACPKCGPRAWLQRAGSAAVTADSDAALAEAVALLRNGRILAVKGIGGYHLLCDARDDGTVARLRQRKTRPDKPLAVMYASRIAANSLADDIAVDAAAFARLRAPDRPILLLQKAPRSSLAPAIAPGLAEVGVMLAYSPLHEILLRDFGGPLVATSGNPSGEPVLTEPEEARTRLSHVADAFLHHDRPIARPADDSVFRAIAGRFRPLRLGRGCAPLELKLPRPVAEPLLAVGAHMKNCIALAWDDRVVVSPHIGDMGSLRSLEVFEHVAADLQALYGVAAARVVHDAHTDYATSRWARRQALPRSAVFHHHAHASALAGEHADVATWLMFTWDGVGLGEDGSLWGGETLFGRPGQWRRVGTLRPFRLPGGERAGREPWRSACALAWELGLPSPFPERDTKLLQHAWERGLNSPLTTAAGRLFDAAAALTGVAQTCSHEGQGPMQFEALCRDDGAALALPLARRADGLWQTDWGPLYAMLSDGGASPRERAETLHASLARAIVEQCLQLRREFDFTAVGLTGGVFQNRHLAELASRALAAERFAVRLAQQLPCNDAGIPFGQINEAAHLSP